MHTPQVVLVTGGCGFIGSNFLNMFVPQNPHIQFVNVDALTYAGNPMNLEGIASAPNYTFEHVNICDEEGIKAVFAKHNPDTVFHFAAESHVDRSILGPKAFIETNVVGTYNLLEAARHLWGKSEGKVFHHVSTDEVYGSLGDEGFFTEETPYDPSSPYSASKASSDHLVRAYNHTYGLPTRITNCSNNYGPYHFPEKLIPLMTLNCLRGKPLPVYGKGANVRDWLFVTDHCQAIWKVATAGKVGETYNVGGNTEKSNLEVVHTICSTVAQELGEPVEKYTCLITYVTDRPGHDFRYAIDASKIKRELGWEPSVTFEEGLRQTVRWYLENDAWIAGIENGAYRNWMDTNYAKR